MLADLPDPWAAHLVDLPSRHDVEAVVQRLTPDELVERVIGHMAHNRGGVCAIARPDEAAADVAMLVRWLGHGPHFVASSQLFRVGRCWSYAYIGLATGRCVLWLFLQID